MLDLTCHVFGFMDKNKFSDVSLRLGDGVGEISLADRATIANMSPEYGATMGFFPVDHVTLQYLKLTGRSDETVSNLVGIFPGNLIAP